MRSYLPMTPPIGGFFVYTNYVIIDILDFIVMFFNLIMYDWFPWCYDSWVIAQGSSPILEWRLWMAGFRTRSRRSYPTDVSDETLPKVVTKAGAKVAEKLFLSKIAQLSPDDAVVVLGAWKPTVSDDFNVVDEHDKEDGNDS